MVGTPRIAGVVNTLNEAHNIRHCLGTLLPWCDEVVVVDQHSDDGTAEIAAQMGARVFQHERTGGIGDAARAFAVAQANADWVLIMDADEMVRPELGRWLREQAAKGEHDVLLVPRVNIVFGRQMQHGHEWPSRRARFFRPGCVDISGRIHHGLVPTAGARVGKVPAQRALAIWHFSYPDISTLLEKVDRYTTIEARQARERGQRPQRARNFVRRAASWFARSYLRRRGYRDGTAGFIVAVTRAYYRFIAAAKLWELGQLEGRQARVAALRDGMLRSHERG